MTDAKEIARGLSVDQRVLLRMIVTRRFGPFEWARSDEAALRMRGLVLDDGDDGFDPTDLGRAVARELEQSNE